MPLCPPPLPNELPDEESERTIRFYRSFFQHTEDMIYALDLNHRFLFANRALLDVWGITWEEARGRNFNELGFDPWLADRLNRETEVTIRTRQHRRGVVPYEGMNGLREYEYLISPILDTHGEVEAVSGVARDVTSRLEAEKQTAFINDLSRKLVTCCTEREIIHTTVNAVGTFLNCDRCYFIELVEDAGRLEVSENFTRDESVKGLEGSYEYHQFGGAEWWLRYSEGDLCVEDAFHHPLTREKAAVYQEIGVRSFMTQPFKRDGQRTVVLGATESSPRKWTQKNLQLLENVVARVWPLVEQARAGEVRLQLLDDLRQVDKRKDRFLATLAHELRNPLAPVLTGIEVIQSSPAEPQVIHQVSGMIRRQIQQMVGLIDDLLEISRIKTGKIVLKKSVGSYAGILRNALDTTAPATREGAHELVVDLPPDETHVEMDSCRVAQIASNLLLNAVRYTQSGGRIHLEAGFAGEDAWLRVTDDGEGIAPAEQETIFDLFHQSHVGSSQGLGVGLTLVKTLVELHEGSVTVFSEGQGRGARFTVNFPGCVRRPPPVPDAPPPPDRPSCKFRKVLVVDDGESAADILSMFFTLEGMETAVAYDGASAVEIAIAFRPDLVVMDLGMPNMDGFEAARHIKLHDPEICLVALSGWGREEDKRRSAEAGFSYHLVKPATPDALREMLHRVS